MLLLKLFTIILREIHLETVNIVLKYFNVKGSQLISFKEFVCILCRLTVDVRISLKKLDISVKNVGFSLKKLLSNVKTAYKCHLSTVKYKTKTFKCQLSTVK